MDTKRSIEMKKIVVELKNVNFFYDEVDNKSLILHNVNLQALASEICAIVGPSGCGKTTLIKLIISLLPLSDGSVKLFGRDAGDPSIGIPGPNVGYMPQEDALPSDLRVRDSLYFFGLLNNMSLRNIRRRMDEVLEQVDLTENSGKFIFQLSGGMKRRLSLAIALLHSPQILLLDEPTVGCDPVLRSRIWSVLKKITSENRTCIVITTHYIEECRLANTINFMREKTFTVQTSPKNIMAIAGTSNLDKAFFRICFSDRAKGISDSTSRRDLVDSEMSIQRSVQPEKTYEDISKRSKNHGPSHFMIILILTLRYIHALVFDLSTFQMIIIMPTFVVFVGHTCLTPRILGAPVGIVIENQTLFYDKQLFDRLELRPKCFECLHPRHFVEYMNREVFKVITYHNLDTALEDVKIGKINGAIYIGDQFSEHYVSRVITHWTDLQETAAKNTIIKFYGDASKRLVFQALDAYLLEAYTKYWEASRVNLGMKNGSLFPFEYEDPVIGQKKDETPDENYFTEIGYFISNAFCGAITTGGFLMLKELRDQTMKRCVATGLKTYHLFAAQIITNGSFVGISIILAMFSVMYILGLPVGSSSIAGGSIGILIGLVGTISGQMIAVALRSEVSILLIGVSTSYLAVAFMSCALPLESHPYYTKTFSQFLPLTIPVLGLRSSLIRGFSFSKLLIIESLAISLLYILILSCIILFILHKSIHK